MTVICIIPARYGSSRLEGKPLADLCGKPMIQRVYEQVKKATLVDKIFIATDDVRIFDSARQFGAPVVMTSPHHLCGTDRITEAIEKIPGDIILNVQGDEPLIDPGAIDALVHSFIEDPDSVMATLITKVTDEGDVHNPNVVKVIKDCDNYALYFSRAPVPYVRDGGFIQRYIQAGVYIFRRDFLKKFSALPPTPCEKGEKLEQLRALEHGYRIKLVETGYSSVSVDTHEDLENVRCILRTMQGSQ